MTSQTANELAAVVIREFSDWARGECPVYHEHDRGYTAGVTCRRGASSLYPHAIEALTAYIQERNSARQESEPGTTGGDQ